MCARSVGGRRPCVCFPGDSCRAARIFSLAVPGTRGYVKEQGSAGAETLRSCCNSGQPFGARARRLDGLARALTVPASLLEPRLRQRRGVLRLVGGRRARGCCQQRSCGGRAPELPDIQPPFRPRSKSEGRPTLPGAALPIHANGRIDHVPLVERDGRECRGAAKRGDTILRKAFPLEATNKMSTGRAQPHNCHRAPQRMTCEGCTVTILVE